MKTKREWLTHPMKTNAQNAFENYLLWLKYSPGDYKGATAAASDFLDGEADLDELTAMFKTLEEATS